MSDEPTLLKAEVGLDGKSLLLTTIPLRDFFAAFALAGICSTGKWSEAAAEEAFDTADAMMAERAKSKELVS